MTRRISLHEMERRRMVSRAKLIMTEAQSRVCDEVGELYITEWMLILNEMQSRMIGELLKDDWQPDGDA